MSNGPTSVLVLGAGTMGVGIAQWFIQSLVKVELSDTNPSVLKQAEKNISESFNKLLEKKKFSAQEIQTFKSLITFKKPEEISKKTDLFIEAIVENLDIKKKVFKEFDSFFGPSTIFASNTSSLSIDDIFSELPQERRKNSLGLHFFNPATLMKLVEIVKGSHTKKELPKELYEWFQTKGKKPAICLDSPGFIVNRLARNYYGEALHIVNHLDLEKISEVDEVMRQVGGFKMGPFELMDLIGIDVNYHVTESVWKSFYFNPRFRPHSLQRKMVSIGYHGRKTKKGFYPYE